MPTIPAMMILSTLETDNHESPSNVLGNEQINVGIAKMPVYSMVQSLLSLRDASAICPASSCPPVANMANTTVPKAKTSRPIGPKRM